MGNTDDQLRDILDRNPGTSLQTVADVLATLGAIHAVLPDDDGLKWFNWQYWTVTASVQQTVSSPGGGGITWRNPDFLKRLDVVFAGIYLDALRIELAGGTPSKCWQVLFNARQDKRLARVQLALAGINAHIDHDLAFALVQTCRDLNIQMEHHSPEQADYRKVNDLLETLVAESRKELMVMLPGDSIPDLEKLENQLAGVGIRVAREAAWLAAEVLWTTTGLPGLQQRFGDSLDTAAERLANLILIPLV
jgi:hypothetical protein